MSKSGSRIAIALCVLGLATVGGGLFYSLKMSRKEPTAAPTPVASPVVTAVTALGRLEPQGETIVVAPPPTLGAAKIAQLLVKQGDRVAAQQTIAILDDRDRLAAALDRANSDVEVAIANLQIVQAGAKTGDVNAARANIARLEAQLQGEMTSQQATIDRVAAEVRNAESEYQRYQQLASGGAIAAIEVDRRRLERDTARESLNEAIAKRNQTQNTLQQQIKEARSTLNSVAEVRPVDLVKASAEVERARAAVKQAQAELAQAYVKAPVSGQILKINTRPGESVGQTGGIIEIGQTDRMVAVAEVYESDIGKVKEGQSAIVKSENGSFRQSLKGVVSEIGLQIGKRSVLETNPAADVDVRVVEVKILLDPADSQRVSSLTNAKVLVEIQLNL
ncbi:ABC exporter membrane fusion protein [Oscillatoria sp. FACHB-1406]|uniref:ABC exporter membrane fusion protein n=1 Tax=Oscillatoria sp. FACHB-1406 TaxID=2692846 RepID=UPI001F558A1F|nr:ABC exporter membrane fusion protein [Oscillatoria sp. FACHB-1406]